MEKSHGAPSARESESTGVRSLPTAWLHNDAGRAGHVGWTSPDLCSALKVWLQNLSQVLVCSSREPQGGSRQRQSRKMQTSDSGFS